MHTTDYSTIVFNNLTLQKDQTMNLQTIKISALAHVATAMVAVISLQAHAQSPIKIDKAWARPTVTAQTVGGGYFEMENTSKIDDALIAVKTAISKTTELHTMSMDGGVMKMRQVPKILLPAGKAVALAPGGLHLMFMGLKPEGLKQGDKFDATLVFEKAGEVKVGFTVGMPASMKSDSKSHAGHKH